MKTKSFIFILIAMLLCGCDNERPHSHVDNDKNHICDSCNEKISDHIDENNDNICDICEQELVLPISYADWPEKDIQDEVIVVSGSSVKIPSYNKADKIEINTDSEIDDGYFSIYCYTKNRQADIEYKAILLEAGWEVSSEKDDQGYFDAYDPNYQVNINFGYFEEFSDLEICVAFCYKTKWPEKDISEALQIVQPGSKTTIPEFEAYTIVASYNSFVNAIAINAIDFKETIIDDYRTTLTNNGWDVFFNDTSSEWNAISPEKDIEIHFYVDNSNYFNVDVFAYTAPVEGWPYKEIEEAIQYLGAEGVVPPFQGECTGFQVDWNYPLAIFIYCDQSKQAEGRDSYNQSLIDSGYICVGDMFDEPMYAKPGTTLALRALIMYGVLQIELFKLNEPAAQL